MGVSIIKYILKYKKGAERKRNTGHEHCTSNQDAHSSSATRFRKSAHVPWCWPLCTLSLYFCARLHPLLSILHFR